MIISKSDIGSSLLWPETRPDINRVWLPETRPDRKNRVYNRVSFSGLRLSLGLDLFLKKKICMPHLSHSLNNNNAETIYNNPIRKIRILTIWSDIIIQKNTNLSIGSLKNWVDLCWVSDSQLIRLLKNFLWWDHIGPMKKKKEINPNIKIKVLRRIYKTFSYVWRSKRKTQIITKYISYGSIHKHKNPNHYKVYKFSH